MLSVFCFCLVFKSIWNFFIGHLKQILNYNKCLMRMCYTNHFYALTNTIILARFCPVVVGPTADWHLLQWISKMGPNFCVFKSVFSLIVFICIFYYHYSHTYILPDWFLPFCYGKLDFCLNLVFSNSNQATSSLQLARRKAAVNAVHDFI